jgi:Rho family protein
MQGLAVARRIRASRYLECSAKHNRGVQECFEESAKCAVSVRQAKGGTYSGGSDSSSCTIS